MGWAATSASAILATMPRHVALFLSGWLAVAPWIGSAATGSPARDRPNVLFIAVDDLRPAIGAYGDPVAVTPHLDQLARQSSLFERAYCNVPVCGASRASIMSGIRPGFDRYRSYYTWLEKETPDAVTLNDHFQQNGYTTLSVGKIYHHIADSSDTWDRVYDSIGESGWRDYALAENARNARDPHQPDPAYEAADVTDLAYRDGRLAQMAVNELQQLARTGEPFFLALGFLKPHLPFNAPRKYWDLYDAEALPVPPAGNNPESAPAAAFHAWGELRAYAEVPAKGPLPDALARKLIHGYYACVSATDAQIGKVLTALERTGLADNTIVVVWGDHGYNLREHGLWCKHCNFNTAMQVPLIIKAPGVAPARISGIAELVDLYPTLCALTGLRPPADQLDGQDLGPLMRDPSLPGDGVAVSKYGNGVTLIEDHLFYTEWRRADDQRYARMLFDHTTDPAETQNLAELPEWADTVARLQQRLLQERGGDFFQPVAAPSTN